MSHDTKQGLIVLVAITATAIVILTLITFVTKFSIELDHRNKIELLKLQKELDIKPVDRRVMWDL